MSSFPAYTIHNLQLTEFSQWLNSPIQGPAYVVLWHKQIPLGHYWLDENSKVDELTTRFNTRLATEDTLQYYALHSSKPIKNFKSIWNWKEAETIAKILESTLPLTNESLPPSVDLSIVICTRHRPEQLAICLASISKLPCKAKEIIVVDNGPDQPETKAITEKFPEVRYIAEPRAGLDIARNTGALAANQEIIAYLDDDVRVHPHWVYHSWKVFQENENIGASTGLVFAEELKTDAQVVFEKYWSFNRGYLPKLYTPSFLEYQKKHGPPVWNIGAGANMAFRKSVFDETGLFDERLDVGAAGCNGDSEMWFRVLKAGYAILYNPLAIVWHTHRTEMSGLRKQIHDYMSGHVAACLIQEEHTPEISYKNHLRSLRLHYVKSVKWGFPRYTKKFSTLKQQMQGAYRGWQYYQQHKK